MEKTVGAGEETNPLVTLEPLSWFFLLEVSGQGYLHLPLPPLPRHRRHPPHQRPGRIT